MSHPLMFDDDDPHLRRVRELTAAFPGSAEKISHGRPAFYTTKVFAYYGGSRKVEEDIWLQHPHSLVVKLDPAERCALLQAGRAYVPAYLGPSGWVGVDLDDKTDWTEISELLDASYRLTAPRRNVDQLETEE